MRADVKRIVDHGGLVRFTIERLWRLSFLLTGNRSLNSFAGVKLALFFSMTRTAIEAGRFVHMRVNAK
jgi:hypothetical protein